MGLLDDAIREHLELKRRHGADSAEVSELERDAFGPARHAPAPLSAAEAGLAGDPAISEPLEGPPAPDARAFAPGDPEAARGAPDPPPAHERGVEAHDRDIYEPRSYDPPPAGAPDPPPRDAPAALAWDEPVSAEREPGAGPEDVLGGVTRAFSADEVAEAQDRPAQTEVPAEDLLEETPEFLQETPEHDRLWFEQRPPRDFDFDK